MVPDGVVDPAPVAGMLAPYRRICQDVLSLLPLQRQPSAGYVQGSVPVCVKRKAALHAPEQTSASTLFSDVAASRACATRVLRRNYDHWDTGLSGHRFERRSELMVGQPLHDSVRRPMQAGIPEMAQVLDGDGRLISDCEFDDFMGYLITSGLGEVRLVTFEAGQRALRTPRAFIGARLEPATAFQSSLLCKRNVPPEIELSGDGTASVSYCERSEMVRANIDSDGSVRVAFRHLFSEYDTGGPIVINSETREGPAPVEMFLEALPRAVHLDWDGYAFSIEPDTDNRIVASGFTYIPASGDIERYRHGADAGARVVSIGPGVRDGVGGELGGEILPDGFITEMVKVRSCDRFIRYGLPVFDGVFTEVDGSKVVHSGFSEGAGLSCARDTEVDAQGLRRFGHLGDALTRSEYLCLTVGFLPLINWGVSAEVVS